LITKPVIVIGYSGHAYVVIDILKSQGVEIFGYCDMEQKVQNPYHLKYMGNEKDDQTLSSIKQYHYFAAIGNNAIRKNVIDFVYQKNDTSPTNAIHCNSFISPTVKLANGIMIGSQAQINAMAKIGDGVICNTGCIIEHECQIGDYCHIAPGAILCGNVTVGKNTMIGAGTVVRQGINIGDNVIVGAGTIVIADIPKNSKVVGNPNRFIWIEYKNI